MNRQVNQLFIELFRDLLSIMQRQAAEIEIHRTTIERLMDISAMLAGGTAEPVDLPPTSDPAMLERAARGLQELERMFAEKTDENENVSE